MPVALPAVVADSPKSFNLLASAIYELKEAISAQQSTIPPPLAALQSEAEALLKHLWSDYVRAKKSNRETAYTIAELETQATCATPLITLLTKTIKNPASIQEDSYREQMDALMKNIEANYKQDATGRKYQRLQRLFAVGAVVFVFAGIALTLVSVTLFLPASSALIIGVSLGGTFGSCAGLLGLVAGWANAFQKMPSYHSKNLFTFYHRVRLASVSNDHAPKASLT